MNFGSKGMKCSEFVELMRNRGYQYDEKNGGFFTGHGKKAGKTTRYGYRTLCLQKDMEFYTFCEHRCVWTWFNGEIPEGYVINHKDFDRGNNRIENLEAITPKENLQYSKDAGRLHPKRGVENGRAKYSEREVQLMRYLRENGWSNTMVASLVGEEYPTIVGRIVRGARYGDVTDAAGILCVYPALVNFTINKDLSKEEQMANAIAGMCGELGEVADILKKHLYQGHELDRDHLIEEMGDLLYYITLLACLIDYNMADTMFNNMDKLLKRYPSGFSAERSIHREEYINA